MSVARRFCDDLAARADLALATGSVDRSLRLGGAVVDLRIAGDGLADILVPALAHAHEPSASSDSSAPSGDDDLDIWVWDRRATGVEPPPPAWPLEDHLPSGAVRGFTDGPVRVTFDRWQRVLTVYDVENRRVIVNAADADLVPGWVRRSPLRQVLTAWAAERGWAMVHGGAVATDDGAVLLAGPSGAGKSTTTLTATAAGFGFMGDDAVLVTFDPTPVAHTVFGRAKLEPDAMVRAGEVGSLAVGTEDGAFVLDPAERLVRRAPLRAVALLGIGSSAATVATRIDATDAFRRLVEGGLDEGAAATLTGHRRLVAEVPCVALTLGRDPSGVVEAVGRLASGVLP